MKPETQRIAIATACGWEKRYYGPLPHNYWWYLNVEKKYYNPPDYLSDLNACYKIEGTLTWEQQRQFAVNLTKLILFKGGDIKQYALGEEANDLDEDYAVLHANAPQRCEAFLKTLNLWTE